MPDFLSGERVELPVGGGGDGFIGRWLAVIRWTFLVQESPKEFPSDVPAPDSYRQTGSWYACYYSNSVTALKASKAMGQEYAPRQVWYFESPIEDVLLPEDVKSNFGAAISMEARVLTLRSGKYRHELHLIALPAAVAAYARMKGFIDYEYDLSELMDREGIFDDAISGRLIGGEFFDDSIDEETNKPVGNIKLPYTRSELWRRRTQLWADLGEEDPRVYKAIGSGILATKSERLNECLDVVNQSWASPVWARVAMVQDPRVDAMSKNDKRLTLPALLEIYEDEGEARAAAGMEEGATGTSQEAPRPPVPSVWEGGAESDWVQTVRAFKAEMGSPPLPVARVKILQMEEDGELTQKLAATAADVLAWWTHV